MKMPTFQDSGRCIGYAHVMFAKKDAYEAALVKSGERLGGRYLDIKEAQGGHRPEPSQSAGKYFSTLTKRSFNNMINISHIIHTLLTLMLFFTMSRDG